MAERTCSIEDCERVHVARGWCYLHWKRWQRTGSTNPRPTIEERFWSYVDRRGPGECWRWTLVPDSDGYAVFHPIHDEYNVKAYRFAYELLEGPIPEGLQLDHLCHDPKVCKLTSTCPHRRCVNPAHLKPVTARDNTLRSNAASALNARKTHCINGHLFDGENTRTSGGRRTCRTCSRDHQTRWRAVAKYRR